MDNNYLLQRRINEQRRFRRKVTVVAVLVAILLLLIIIGLVKVITDEKKAETASKNNIPGTEQLTPGAPEDNSEEAPGHQEIPATPTLVPTLEPTSTPTPTPVPANGPKIIVDPGHGGEDLGSVRNSEGIREKNINLVIALHLQKFLEDAGYQVYMIRTEDVDVDNKSRPETAIREEGDAYISIHLNSLEEDSDGTQGVETWYTDLPDAFDDESGSFAQFVVDEVAKATGTRNRGIKKSNNLIVLKYNGMPACLVECGFLTSETERARLIDPEYQKLLAEGICNGIKKFLPIEE